MKKIGFALAVVGLILVLFGLVLINATVSNFQSPLNLMTGNAFQADFLPNSPTINQGQSVTFSITNLTPYNSYDSVSQIETCVWKIDGSIVSSSDSTTFVYVGNSLGSHTVEVALSFMYNNWQYTETLIGSTTVTVLANSATTTPHPTGNPTPTPFHPTPSPTPMEQTPHPTSTPTQSPIIPTPKNNIELILMIALGALMEVGGAFCLLIARRF